MAISFRMPESWQGKVSDRQLIDWLHECAIQGPALPADPGPGSFKRSFRLPEDDQRLIERLAGGDVSSFLRRLMAYRLGVGHPPIAKPATVAAPPPSRSVSQQPPTANAPQSPALPSVPPELAWMSYRSPRTPQEHREYQQWLTRRFTALEAEKEAWKRRCGAADVSRP